MTIVSYSEKKKKGKRRSSRRNSLRLFSRAPPIVQRKTRSRDCSQLLKNDASFSPSSKKQWHWTKKKKQKERKRCHLRLITRRWQNVEQPTEMTVSELKQPRIACETSDCDNVTRLSSSRWLHWNVMQRSFLHLGINTRSEFRATVPRSVKRKKRDPL